MTQQSVYKFLQKQKKWISTKDIKEKMKLSSAADNLRKLFKNGDIIRRNDKFGNIIRYVWKIKE